MLAYYTGQDFNRAREVAAWHTDHSTMETSLYLAVYYSALYVFVIFLQLCPAAVLGIFSSLFYLFGSHV